jgi:outer membrane protein OmpA-like peptidoglycan-associated protein
MKKLILFTILGLFLQAPLPAEAQILKDITKKVTKKAERKADQKIDKTIDKGFEEVEEEMKKEKEEGTQKDEESTEDTKIEEQGQQKTGKQSEDKILKPWSKYDFVPGDLVIFEDNLEGEQNGEFPSQWDLIDGYVENALFADENVIRFPIESSGATIKPLLKKKGDYLPDKFTIEFDMYLSSRTSKYTVYLWDKGKSFHRPDGLHAIDVGNDQEASYAGGKMYRKLPKEAQKAYPHWRHVAISFNVRALKIYIDQERLIMVPNVEGNPTALSIKGSTYDFSQTGDYPTLIKNIRIAEGAVKLYDRFITDGKIIANGIKFDSGEATLKPESMGVINEIVKLMKQHPEIKFSIEGHTDSDGEVQFNKTLSEQRAKTVMNQLAEQGIASDRMVSKGFGEDVPVANNSTAEGKANNRRVEFVKMTTVN